eukprot:g2976.t1
MENPFPSSCDKVISPTFAAGIDAWETQSASCISGRSASQDTQRSLYTETRSSSKLNNGVRSVLSQLSNELFPSENSQEHDVHKATELELEEGNNGDSGSITGDSGSITALLKNKDHPLVIDLESDSNNNTKHNISMENTTDGGGGGGSVVTNTDATPALEPETLTTQYPEYLGIDRRPVPDCLFQETTVIKESTSQSQQQSKHSKVPIFNNPLATQNFYPKEMNTTKNSMNHLLSGDDVPRTYDELLQKNETIITNTQAQEVTTNDQNNQDQDSRNKNNRDLGIPVIPFDSIVLANPIKLPTPLQSAETNNDRERNDEIEFLSSSDENDENWYDKEEEVESNDGYEENESTVSQRTVHLRTRYKGVDDGTGRGWIRTRSPSEAKIEPKKGPMPLRNNARKEIVPTHWRRSRRGRPQLEKGTRGSRRSRSRDKDLQKKSSKRRKKEGRTKKKVVSFSTEGDRVKRNEGGWMKRKKKLSQQSLDRYF